MLLSLENVSAGYGDLKVLYDVSLEIRESKVVALVGPNGAGKTTILNIISNFVPVTAGKVIYDGKDLTKLKKSERAGVGIAHIPQGRGILDSLTVVKENLILAAFSKKEKNKNKLSEDVERLLHRFPILKERENQAAGSLSGGQQQMLAIACSLMMEPRLLILDESSLGLAPIIVKDMFKIISEVSKQGMSIFDCRTESGAGSVCGEPRLRPGNRRDCLAGRSERAVGKRRSEFRHLSKKAPSFSRWSFFVLRRKKPVAFSARVCYIIVSVN